MQLLETERLLLRPFTKDDVESYYEVYWQIAAGHNGQQRQADEHPNVDDIRDENAYYLGFANYSFLQPFGRWMMVLKTERQNIGACLLIPQLFTPDEVALCAAPESHKPRFGAFEISMGWALARSYRGDGYAAEAARRLIAYGFDTVKLQRVMSWADPDNIASISVMRKVGMQIVSPPEAKRVISIIENDHPLTTQSGYSLR